MSQDIRATIVDLQTEMKPLLARLAIIRRKVVALQTKEAPLRTQIAEIQGGIDELRASCRDTGHVGGDGRWCIICGAWR